MLKGIRLPQPVRLVDRNRAKGPQRDQLSLRIIPFLYMIAMDPVAVCAQGASLFAGPVYGFGAGTVRTEYAQGKTYNGHGPGLLIGGAFDTGAESVVHWRIRFGWQRQWWEESFHSPYYIQAWTGDFMRVEYIGMVSSRMDQITVSPLWLIPISHHLRMLFGADLGMVVANRAEDRTRMHATDGSGFPDPESGAWVYETIVDTIGTGMRYINEYQLAIPLGVEVDLPGRLRLSGELSIGTGRLATGRPPRYARLMISYVFGRKSAKSPVENSPQDR